MIKVTPQDHTDFIEHCRKKVPSFTVYDGKEDSFLMNFMYGIVYPFNSGFMEDYITTVAGDVFFPKGSMRKHPTHALEVMGHEFIHASDSKKLSYPAFSALYLSAISLFLVSLVMFGLLVSLWSLLPFGWLAFHAAAVGISKRVRKITGAPLLVLTLWSMAWLVIGDVGWDSLWLLGSLALLAPIPAPGRAWAEMRGYGASVAIEVALFGRASIQSKVHQFTGPAYYWMWPFASWVAKKLKSYETRALNGEIEDPDVLHVLEFIEELKLRQGTNQ